MSRPFIVTVASEKGGVGKTTIATNLAVYLKALHEDLPVTIASFDNHFSIDHMFALGPRPAAGMSELVDRALASGVVSFGQYGVQYLASARRLTPPPAPPQSLRSRFEALNLDGILILDTRPILDWFTEAALLAADLVLTPVKDRAALVNAAALRAVLQGAGRADRLWLVPSLVDARARLNDEVRVHEFLAFAARERDYQVADLVISKSPKVESLASGFSNRILPILTHARQTAVHGQMRQLAEFVLARRATASQTAAELLPGAGASPPVRRLVEECPVCAERSLDGGGHPFFDLRSRRRGMVHPDCFRALLDDCEISLFSGADNLLVLEVAGPGMLTAEGELQVHLFDAANRLVVSERIADAGASRLCAAVEGMGGRKWLASRREWFILGGGAEPASVVADRAARQTFALRRRAVLREALGKPARHSS